MQLYTPLQQSCNSLCLYECMDTTLFLLREDNFPSNPPEGSKNSARSPNQHTEAIKHKKTPHSLSLTNIKYF